MTVTEVIVDEGAEGVGVRLPLDMVEPPPQPASRRAAPKATYLSTGYLT